MEQAIIDLFRRYDEQTNAALRGRPDMVAVGDLYEGAFIAAGPSGVMAGKKDDEFTKTIEASFAHYRDIGTRSMHVANVQIEPIDALHALARVAWRATYDKNGAEEVIDFTNCYLVRIVDGRATVFGWITGDENAELREHGIV